MIWIDVREQKPELGQEVLVFCQGYGDAANYWSDYELAIYMKSPYDRRRYAFAKSLHIKVNTSSPWLYHDVTHWMPLPEPPPKIAEPIKGVEDES